MAATAKEQSLGTKPTTLAVVFVLLALFRSSISLLDVVYVVHFLFGARATMEFSDRESSPDPSRSNGSSVEFVVETPGPDWEDDPSTIVLRDNEEGPPKPKKTLTEYFMPTPRSTLPFMRIVPHSQPTSSAYAHTEKLSNVSSSL